MKALLLCVCMLMSLPLSAGEMSIHRMMMDGRILELGETRQLTIRADGEVTDACISPDGKYVVYSDFQPTGHDRLCLVRVDGGRPTVIMSVPPNYPSDSFTGEVWKPRLMSKSQIAWSPDSKLFALPVSRVVVGEKGSPLEYGVAVYRSTGALRAYFPAQESASPVGPLLWSPDCTSLAGTWSAWKPEGRYDLCVFEIASGSAKMLVSRPKMDISLDSWRSDSKSLQYTVVEGGKAQLREFDLDSKEEHVIQAEYTEYLKSPDGLRQLANKPGISIKNCLTGEVTDIVKTSEGQVLGWAPNSKILIYQKPTVVKDETGKRERTLNMLWLASIEANPINHMCAALDSIQGQPPTWSKDCMKMAYVSERRVYVAEFAWKPLAMDDKLAAGLPLTEEEEKDFLTANAKQLGVAFNMYTSDNDDKYPSADTYMQDVLVYSRNESLFNRPGTNQPVFQYFPPGSEPNLANSASIVMGFFDVGYGWKVILYVDGHVQVVPK